MIKDLIEKIKNKEWNNLTKGELIEILEAIESLTDNQVWLDDYLNRAENVVISALRRDKFSEIIKDALRKKELNNKNREKVLDEL